MQKGSLEFQDYMRLGVIVLLYWVLRPHIQRLVKKWSDDAVHSGEKEQEAYQQRRAQAATSNDIRSGKKTKDGEGKTLGQLLDEGAEGLNAEATGAKATAASESLNGQVKNRKQKKKGVSFAPEKSEADKTLDWEDESEFDPRSPPLVSEGGTQQTGDIKEWMEKWTS